ncbi:MAG: response regulator [Thermodesulfobacteriota bacterium]|nr:response regulator [Thermodesulfobacteriota bacterium]
MTRILLIVKDRTLLELIRIFVTTICGHSLETAADGIEAIEKCRTSDFDLVIMDLKMNGRNGDGLIEKIRYLVGAPTPFIGLASEPQDLCVCDCEHVIHKPFSVTELHDAISACVT